MPSPGSTVFQPMCGSTGASSSVTTPGHSPRPSVSTPALDAALEQHLHPDADAQNRATAGEPTVDDLVAAARAQRVHDRAERPHAGNDEPAASSISPRSAVSLASAPAAAERLHRGVHVARPVVQHRDQRPVASQSALRARNALHQRVERLRLAERARERLVFRLGDVVRVAPCEHGDMDGESRRGRRSPRMCGGRANR